MVLSLENKQYVLHKIHELPVNFGRQCPVAASTAIKSRSRSAFRTRAKDYEHIFLSVGL